MVTSKKMLCISLLCISAGFIRVANAQSSIDYQSSTEAGKSLQEKYWYYRYKFNRDFIVRGIVEPNCSATTVQAAGFSLPISHIVTGVNTADPKEIEELHWGDAPQDLGYYIAVLATEYANIMAYSKGTTNQNRIHPLSSDPIPVVAIVPHDSTKAYNSELARRETLKELKEAIMAFKRIDMNAEYLTKNQTHINDYNCSRDLNGFFMRDDVQSEPGREEDSTDITNPSELIKCYQNRGYKVKKVKSDFLSYHNKPNFDHFYNAGSVDHMSYLLMGFALVNKLVRDTDGHDFALEDNFNYVNEAKNCALSLIRYCERNRYFYTVPVTPSSGCRYYNTNNEAYKELSMSAYNLYGIGKAIHGNKWRYRDLGDNAAFDDYLGDLPYSGCTSETDLFMTGNYDLGGALLGTINDNPIAFVSWWDPISVGIGFGVDNATIRIADYTASLVLTQAALGAPMYDGMPGVFTWIGTHPWAWFSIGTWSGNLDNEMLNAVSGWGGGDLPAGNSGSFSVTRQMVPEEDMPAFANDEEFKSSRMIKAVSVPEADLSGKTKQYNAISYVSGGSTNSPLVISDHNSTRITLERIGNYLYKDYLFSLLHDVMFDQPINDEIAQNAVENLQASICNGNFISGENTNTMIGRRWRSGNRFVRPVVAETTYVDFGYHGKREFNNLDYMLAYNLLVLGKQHNAEDYLSTQYRSQLRGTVNGGTATEERNLDGFMKNPANTGPDYFNLVRMHESITCRNGINPHQNMVLTADEITFDETSIVSEDKDVVVNGQTIHFTAPFIHLSSIEPHSDKDVPVACAYPVAHYNSPVAPSRPETTAVAVSEKTELKASRQIQKDSVIAILASNEKSGYIPLSNYLRNTGNIRNNLYAVSLSVSPNPAKSSFSLSVTSPEAIKADVILLDYLGRELKVLQTGAEFNAGSTSLTLSCDGIVSGTYFVRIMSSKYVETTKLIKQ